MLAPTRELVNQIDEVIQPLAEAYGMSTVTVYGGVSYARQVAGLRAGAISSSLARDVLRICCVRASCLWTRGDHDSRRGDEMADMGFLPPVTRLLEQTDSRGQRMLFSATLDHGRGRAGQAVPAGCESACGQFRRLAGRHDDPSRVRSVAGQQA